MTVATAVTSEYGIYCSILKWCHVNLISSSQIRLVLAVYSEFKNILKSLTCIVLRHDGSHSGNGDGGADRAAVLWVAEVASLQHSGGARPGAVSPLPGGYSIVNKYESVDLTHFSLCFGKNEIVSNLKPVNHSSVILTATFKDSLTLTGKESKKWGRANQLRIGQNWRSTPLIVHIDRLLDTTYNPGYQLGGRLL